MATAVVTGSASDLTGRTDSRKPTDLVAALCHELVVLAKVEADTAAAEASRVPCWAAHPPSVTGHREAARALRGASGSEHLDRVSGSDGSDSG